MKYVTLTLVAWFVSLGTVCAELEIQVGPAGPPPVDATDNGAPATAPIAVPPPGKPANTEVVVGQTAPVGDVMGFLNGDSLHGLLAGIDQNGQLKWDHPDVEGETVFKLENLKTIALGGHQDVSGGEGFAHVRLTNDDTFSGTIVEMTEDQLILNTWYAGRMAIERPMLKSISPGVTRSSYVYEGPDGLDGWDFGRQGAQVWTFKKGAF